MKKIRHDESGAVLVEFTLILPLIFLLLAFGLSAFQLLNLRQSTQFVAQASAASGARALVETCETGCIDKARQLATTTYTANLPAFIAGTTANLDEVTALTAAGNPTTMDTEARLLRVRVSATVDAWMPLLSSSFNSAVTAVD